jgi:flagellar hook protein FlgE
VRLGALDFTAWRGRGQAAAPAGLGGGNAFSSLAASDRAVSAVWRAGAFSFDPTGKMVTADGAVVQGWSAQDGVVNTGQATGNIVLPLDAVAPARATTTASVTGNLPSTAAVGDELVRDVKVYDAQGTPTTLSLTFTRTATGWDVTDPASGATGALSFTDGVQTAPGLTLVAGAVTVDLGAVTGYADLSTVAVSEQNGAAAGTLKSYSITGDGSIVGTFSNGATQTLGKIAMATFANPEGLEKAGGTAYRVSVNSGGARVGEPGDAGFGDLVSGALEMSNVDLSQEFINLIISSTGFSASSRVITTSDQLLTELLNSSR